MTNHIGKAKVLAERGQFDEALAECEAAIRNVAGRRDAVLRVRAYVNSLKGDYHRAIEDRTEIIRSGQGELGDYFRLGDNFLAVAEFDQAKKWFAELLRRGSDAHDDWFTSVALLLSAYCEMELGLFDLAVSTAQRVREIDADCQVPVPARGLWNVDRLLLEIDSRRKGG
jgi:tetratricopeptide (TPR) repeat protein